MKVIAYYRVETPEQRQKRDDIRAGLAAVRRWAQGLEQMVQDRDLLGTARQARHIVRGLRIIERKDAGR